MECKSQLSLVLRLLVLISTSCSLATQEGLLKHDPVGVDTFPGEKKNAVDFAIDLARTAIEKVDPALRTKLEASRQCGLDRLVRNFACTCHIAKSSAVAAEKINSDCWSYFGSAVSSIGSECEPFMRNGVLQVDDFNLELEKTGECANVFVSSMGEIDGPFLGRQGKVGVSVDDKGNAKLSFEYTFGGGKSKPKKPKQPKKTKTPKTPKRRPRGPWNQRPRRGSSSGGGGGSPSSGPSHMPSRMLVDYNSDWVPTPRKKVDYNAYVIQ